MIVIEDTIDPDKSERCLGGVPVEVVHAKWAFVIRGMADRSVVMEYYNALR